MSAWSTMRLKVAAALTGMLSLTATAFAAPIPVPPPAQTLGGGLTTVRLDAAPVLTSLGVGVGLLGSANLVNATPVPTVSFPITGGALNAGVNPVPGVPAALIEHDNSGLRLTAGSIVVDLENFLIDTQSLTLFGKVTNGGSLVGSQIPLFAIGLSGESSLPFSLSLTGAAANALNSFFSVTAFSSGLAIGVAGTDPQVPEPAALSLAALGLAAAIGMRRRRRMAAAA